jgi:hypothetical protein
VRVSSEAREISVPQSRLQLLCGFYAIRWPISYLLLGVTMSLLYRDGQHRHLYAYLPGSWVHSNDGRARVQSDLVTQRHCQYRLFRRQWPASNASAPASIVASALVVPLIVWLSFATVLSADIA